MLPETRYAKCGDVHVAYQIFGEGPAEGFPSACYAELPGADQLPMASDSDVRGIAVHIASRVAGLAGPGEAVVSRTVKDLVAGSGLAFEDFGIHRLKGVPDDWQLFRPASPRGAP